MEGLRTKVELEKEVLDVLKENKIDIDKYEIIVDENGVTVTIDDGTTKPETPVNPVYAKIYSYDAAPETYLLELSRRDCASNNCNVLGLNALINQAAYSGDMIYGISYAFRAFLIGTTIRPDTSYTSVNFSLHENANAYWAKLSEIESIDNCFPEIDYRVYQSIEEGVIPQQEKKLAPLYK